MNKMQTEPLTAADATEVDEEPKRNITRTIVMLIVPALLIIGGAYYWLTSGGTSRSTSRRLIAPITHTSNSPSSMTASGTMRIPPP